MKYKIVARLSNGYVYESTPVDEEQLSVFGGSLDYVFFKTLDGFSVVLQGDVVKNTIFEIHEVKTQ
jgi:hypothetical protein